MVNVGNQVENNFPEIPGNVHHLTAQATIYGNFRKSSRGQSSGEQFSGNFQKSSRGQSNGERGKSSGEQFSETFRKRSPLDCPRDDIRKFPEIVAWAVKL